MAVLRMTLVALCLLAAPVAAQNVSIVGVWRATEGTPSGTGWGVTASDVQTLTFTADGQYRRVITVEGGNGTTGASGTIVDSGQYRFVPPQTLEYSRQSWVICTTACVSAPTEAPPPNQGSLPFQINAQGQALFIGLIWTRVQ